MGLMTNTTNVTSLAIYLEVGQAISLYVHGDAELLYSICRMKPNKRRATLIWQFLGSNSQEPPITFSSPHSSVLPSNVRRQEAVSLQLVEEYMVTRYARMHGLQRGANHDWEATSICALLFAPQAFSWQNPDKINISWHPRLMQCLQ
jgi:hypothetical protein